MPVEKQIEAEPYESLEKLIEPFIAMVFAKLPANVQQRWESEDLTHTWDSIGIGWRRSLAQQHDCQHDPANRQANQYDYDLTIQIQQTENCIRELELTNPQGVPSELVTKNQALDAAKARLRNLTALSKLPSFVVSDWNDLGDAKLAAILAANTLASAPVIETVEDNSNGSSKLLVVTPARKDEENYLKCVEYGLTMPTELLRPMPRGISKVAKILGMTRQSLTESVKKHIDAIHDAKK